MESEVADGLIDYLHSTNPSMATKLTMERMNMAKQILTLRDECERLTEDNDNQRLGLAARDRLVADRDARVFSLEEALRVAELFFDCECVEGSKCQPCGECGDAVPWDGSDCVVCRSCVSGTIRRVLET